MSMGQAGNERKAAEVTDGEGYYAGSGGTIVDRLSRKESLVIDNVSNPPPVTETLSRAETVVITNV